MSAKIFNLFGNNKKYPSFFRINLTKAFTILIIRRIGKGYYFFKKVCLSEEKIVLLRPNYITEVENLINCLNMPVKIRLQRHGKKGKPFYWVVAADVRAPRDGKFLQKIGTYNPNTNPAQIEIDIDEAVKWLHFGAQPTETARRILSYKGVLLKYHLQGGVKKGALTQEQADAKFATWLSEKEQKISQKKDALQKGKASAKQESVKAEQAYSQKRKEAIVAKAQATEAPAESSSEETANETEA